MHKPIIIGKMNPQKIEADEHLEKHFLVVAILVCSS